MKCPKCQFENVESAKFCNTCGNKLEVICPACAKGNPPGSKFCNECGHQLTLPAKPIPKELSFDEKLKKIQKYLPGGLTEKILAQKGKIEGERRQVTVMFCDLKGYTPLTEMLGEEEAYNLMNQVYDILIQKVNSYEGTVNELTGDGIMAVFGAPIALEDAPQRAVRAALEIHQTIKNLSDNCEQIKGIPPLRMRIGIHTGPVVVGTLGNDLRVEFKAVGDTVNLASRMEGLAEPGTTYTTHETYRIIKEYFEFKKLGEIQVKGKEKAIEAYQVLGLGRAKSRLDAAKVRGLGSFIGRGKELEFLKDRFERAKFGRGQVVGIVGEAGIGKSRLVLEFKSSLAGDDFTFVEGQCNAFQQNTPNHIFREMVRKYFGIQDEEVPAVARKRIRDRIEFSDKALIQGIIFLCEIMSVPSEDHPPKDLEEKRRLIFDAVKTFFLKESQARPLIIVADNLQWADKASERLLDYLVESIPNSRILILGIYRPGYTPSWSSKSYYSQITLNALSPDESVVLAKSLLHSEDLSESLRRLVLDRAEGNPLYMEELIHWLIEMGAIMKSEKGYAIAESSSTLSVPETIQEVIMARIDRLEQDLKRTMQIAAVIGRDFLFRLLKRISDVGDLLQTYLMKLQGLEFIYEKNLFPELEYMFRHILIQDVAYHSLLTQTRKEFHEKIGNAMEEMYKDRLYEHCERLAYHYEQSGTLGKAAEYLYMAGKKAAGQLANAEAMTFCGKALKILEQLRDVDKNQKLRTDIEFLQLELKAISSDIVPF